MKNLCGRLSLSRHAKRLKLALVVVSEKVAKSPVRYRAFASRKRIWVEPFRTFLGKVFWGDTRKEVWNMFFANVGSRGECRSSKE
ncbi:hypothetical protein N9D23_15755 [Rubripirellula sp.]|nr:hypothetical protein [Rubripirellula sp.]